MRWFRAHSYQAWIDHNVDVFASSGCELPASDAGPIVRNWRQWCFHPLWSFAWADQEEWEYLRTEQLDITVLREAVGKRSWASLKVQLSRNHDAYRAPVAAWRLYLQLPCESSDGMRPISGAYPYSDLVQVWHTAMKNLTLHQMAITATAIKRFELRDGKAPSNLEALVPEFLAAKPTDFMNGQPLRYRLNTDGTFTLCSVGDNLRDDSVENARPWSESGWLWPEAIANGKGVQISEAKFQKQSE
jgi:hypothetical protein